MQDQQKNESDVLAGSLEARSLGFSSPEARQAHENACLELYHELTQKNVKLREWLDLAEAWRIRQVLKECKGNRSAAARALGIGRRTLYSKMERLQITPPNSLSHSTIKFSSTSI